MVAEAPVVAAGRERQRSSLGLVALVALVLAAVAGTAVTSRPVITPTRAVLALARPPATPWAAVGEDAFPVGTAIGGIVASGDRLVAVGTAGGRSTGGWLRPGVWTSRDARAWTPVPESAVALDQAWADAGVRMHDVAALGDVLVAVGESNRGTGPRWAAWASTDGGASWQVSAAPQAAGDGGRPTGRADTDDPATAHALATLGSGFVAVGGGQGTAAAWLSLDGISWERATVPNGRSELVDVAGGPGGAVALDAAGQLWHSQAAGAAPGGRVWSRVQGRWPAFAVRGVATAFDGSFVAVGSWGPPGGARDGAVLRSPDGRTWSQATDLFARLAGAEDTAFTGFGGSTGAGVIAVGEVGIRAAAFVSAAAADAGWVREELPAPAGTLSSVAGALHWHGTDVAWGRVEGWDGPAARVWARGGEPRVLRPATDGDVLVLSYASHAAVLDTGSGTARAIGLDALAPADARWGMLAVEGGLVLQGADGAYALRDLHGPPRLQPLGPAYHLVRSGTGGGVWLVTDAPRAFDGRGGAEGGGGTVVMEVALDGTVVTPPARLPPGRFPIAGRGGGLVLQGGPTIELWSQPGSAAPGSAVAFPGVIARVLSAEGDLLAWCPRERCTDVAVGTPVPGGSTVAVHVGDVDPADPRRHEAGAVNAAIAPGGRFVALVVATVGREPQDVVIVDLAAIGSAGGAVDLTDAGAAGDAVAVVARDLAYPQIAWEPTGSRLYAVEQRGSVRVLDPASGLERVVAHTLGRSDLYGLAALSGEAR